MDEIGKAIAEIDSLLSTTESHVAHASAIYEEMFVVTHRILGTFESDLLNLAEKKSAYLELNQAVLGRINDIEIGLSEQHINEELSIPRLQPIEDASSGISIKIEPVSKPVIILAAGKRNVTDRKNYAIELRIDFLISTNRQNQEKLTLVQSINLYESAPGRVGVIAQMGPRFENDAGIAKLPISKLPVAQQSKVRETLIQKIFQLLSDVDYELENIVISDIIAKPQLDSFFYFGSAVFIQTSAVTRKVDQVRTPLDRVPSSRDLSIAFCRELIVETIRQQIKKPAKLTGAEFFDGYINISTHARVREDILWVAVITDAYINYRVLLLMPSQNVIVFEAVYRNWEYHIKAKRCAPVCDKVMRIANRLARSEIQKKEVVIETLGSIARYARESSIEVTKRGMILHMTK